MERTFAAPAARVFEAFTSEEVLRRWFHAGSDWSTPEASVDLRVGGELRVVMHNPHEDERYGARGRYTEIDPPKRLAFTWLWDDEDLDQVEQLVEVDFSERGGVTRVRFTHKPALGRTGRHRARERLGQGVRQPRARSRSAGLDGRANQRPRDGPLVGSFQCSRLRRFSP